MPARTIAALDHALNCTSIQFYSSAEACLLKLGSMPFKAWKLEILVVAGKPGEMAWHRRMPWCFYPRNLVLKTGSLCLHFHF